jgi:hypothetical protein
MEQALTLSGPKRRRVQLRDGLLIAMLAARAARLRTLFELKVGDLRRDEEGWTFSAEPDSMKAENALSYGLPRSLAPWVDRYLVVERDELRDGAATTAF